MFSLSTFCTVCSFASWSPLWHEFDVLYYVFIAYVSSYSIFLYTIFTFPLYLYIIYSFVYVSYIHGEQDCGFSCFVFTKIYDGCKILLRMLI